MTDNGPLQAAADEATPWSHPLRSALKIWLNRPYRWLWLLIPALAQTAVRAPNPADADPENIAPYMISWLAYMGGSLVVFIFLALPATAALHGVIASEIAGQPVGPLAALRRSVSRLPIWIGASIGIWVVFFAGIAAVATPIFFLLGIWAGGRMGSDSGLGSDDLLMLVFGVLLMIVLLLPLLYLTGRMALLGPRALLAPGSLVEVIRDSWRVTRGRVLTLWINLIAILIPMVILTVGITAAASGGLSEPPSLPVQLATATLSYLYTPFYTAVLILLWYKFRAKDEELTREVILAELPGTAETT
jgi:hypothetical protein